jgi:hypothetical protein
MAGVDTVKFAAIDKSAACTAIFATDPMTDADKPIKQQIFLRTKL